MIARRDFVRSLVGGTAAAVLSTRELAARAERIALEPYAPLGLRRGAPVRVRGRVTADGRGVARVLVSDGLSVVRTDSSGAYELLSDAMRSHVMVTVPDAHEIPRSPMGTAAFYMPLAPDPRGEQRADFAIVRAPSAARHATLFFADPQTEDAEEMGFLHAQTVPDVRATVERLGVPAVGVAVGDIMFDNLDLYPDYERAVQAMGVPFYQVIGNHDLDFDARVDEASTATFSRHFGPRYYSFERGALHYVILDDVLWHGAGYIGHLGAEQLAWLANDLAHIITGHMHESEHLYAHGVHENVIGAICGAWWSGPICGDGTPNGYAIYEVDGESVRWTYKATGQPLDHQLRAHGVGSDPSAPTEIVANVWDADPEWAIVWYEDGDRRGAMARRVGRDPLSMEMHSGPELPPKRPWVDPYMTGHLYYAPVSPTANDVVVEATDRFGRSYTARITPRA
jgi:hypothetical protein